VGVGDDEGDPRQTPGDEDAEKRHPARSVFGAKNVDAEDLPVALGTHAGRDDRRHRDDPATLAHLVEERVEPDVGVGAGVEWTVAKLRDLLVEVLRELRDLGLGDPVDSHRLHEIVDATRRDAFDVGLADDRDERLFDAPARLEEPGHVAAVAELGDIEADRAGPGVPATDPVAVATVLAIFRSLAVAGVADHVDVRVH
jgi:hypothetical protein